MSVKIINSLSSVQDKNGFYYGIKDKLFKSIIFNDKELMTWFVSKLMGVEVNDVIIRNVESPVYSNKEKVKRMDMVLEVNTNIYIVIEANSRYTKILHMKNYNYLSSLYSQLIASGEKYNPNKRIIHFDITRRLPKKYTKDINRVKYQTDELSEYLPNVVTFIENVDKMLKYWYNENEKMICKYAHIIMLVLNEEELDKLINYVLDDDKKYIRKFRKDLVFMNKDIKFRRWISEEDEQLFMLRGEIDEAREEGRKEGIEQGIEQGIENTNINIIKNMIKNNMSIETISKCVNLPISKVKQMIINL